MPRSIVTLAISLLVSPAGLLAPHVAAAGDWTTVSLGTTGDLHELNYGGFSDRWLAGDDGFLASSTDLQSWTSVEVDSTADLLSIVRWTSSAFLVGGGSGAVYLSTNGGVSWSDASLPDTTQSYSLYSRTSGAANAVGDGGDIYQTIDAGSNWSIVYAGDTPLHDGSGFIGSTSWAVGDSGRVLMTVDGGDNWSPQPTGFTDDLLRVLEFGGFLFAVGENGTILRSPDQGMTWVRQVTGTTQTIRDISVSNVGGALFAVGDGGTVLRSLDFGDEWCTIDAGTSENLAALSAVSVDQLVVVGEAGLALYTETGGGPCGDIVPVNPGPLVHGTTPAVLRLLPGRPNPFASSTSLRLGIPADAVGTLRVFVLDGAGRLVARLLDAPLSGGAHVVSWDGTSDTGQRVASGTYFVRAVTDAAAVTTRVVRLR